MQKDKLAALNTRGGGSAETTKNDCVMCKTLSILCEQPRLAERKAERKTLYHYTDPGLQFATGGQSSFCVHGGATFMGQGLEVNAHPKVRMRV